MKKICSLFLIILILCVYSTMWTQQGEPIEISSLIGKKLDKVERNYFKLFPLIEGFREALFYLNSDSSLRVAIVYEKDGHLRDTVINKYKSIKQVQNHIEQFVKYHINDIEQQDRGKFTTCTLIDRSKISGELLAVRQNSVLIYGIPNKSYEDKERALFFVNKIHENNINNVYIKEKSTLLSKIIYPIIGGILGGLAGYNLQKDDQYDPDDDALIKFTPQAKVTFIGILAGVFVGSLASVIIPIEVESETVFETPFNESDIEGLREYARYKYTEPYYLTKIK